MNSEDSIRPSEEAGQSVAGVAGNKSQSRGKRPRQQIARHKSPATNRPPQLTNQVAESSSIPAELRTQPVAHDGGGINKDQNAPDNGTLIEQAETRTKEANLRTDQANTRTDEANTRTSLANTRTAEANTRTDEANTRTTEANTRTERADLRTEKAETQTEALRTSELSYRRLFESARDGILVLNADTGRIIDVNDFLVEMLGYSRAEIVGKTVGELSPLKDILSNQAVLERLQKDGYIRYEDLPLETCDGRRIAVEFVSNLYQVGDIKVIQCNIRDITEHKRTEAAMFASEARYRRLFEAAKDGILILNAATGRIVDANPFLAELLGDAREAFIGKHLWELGFFKDIAANEANFKELQAKDYVRYDDLPLETSDGRRINVEFVSNAYNVDGHRVVQCNIRDITERKRTEVALHTAQLFLTEIVNALPVRVFWKDKNLVYLGCNTVFARDAGIAGPKDIIGKDDRQMVWREQAEAFRSDDREVIMSGQSKLLIEESKPTPDGKTITVLASKIPLCDAKGEIIGMIGTYMDITARKRVQESQTRLAMAVEQATETVVITDTEGKIVYANPVFEKTSGYTCAEALGQNPRILKSGKHNAEFYCQMWAVLRRGETWSGHFINRRKDGTLYEEESTISPVRDAAGKVVNYVAVKRDVTKEVQLEAQLNQSQKMEAFGQLAGGVAHDFNNILAVIQLQAGLLKSRQGLSLEQLDFAREIEKSAQRGADLTRQLLLFSRKQIMQAKNLEMKNLVDNMAKMLRRTLGEQVELQLKLAPEPLVVHADPGMMDQILLNLTVNARDAMPKGGQIIIETSAVEFDEVTAKLNPQARSGSFVCLSVTDTGCGIPPEILPRIFEPFFTTKEVGKGTGLGLATVFGIVQQHQGWINVDSEVNRGTTFRVYLPRQNKPSDTEFFWSQSAAIRGGKETVLLVEDELAVRNAMRIALSQLGYRVLDASNGNEALAIWKEHRDEIRLLLTDLVMPGGTNGKELAAQFLQANPKLKVIYASGYSVEIAGQDLLLEDGVNFLPKPFQIQKLAQTIRKRLDQN